MQVGILTEQIPTALYNTHRSNKDKVTTITQRGELCLTNGWLYNKYSKLH